MIMNGVSTGESYPYMVESSLMHDLHCTYDELLAMPYDLIEVLVMELSARNKWIRKKQEQG